MTSPEAPPAHTGAAPVRPDRGSRGIPGDDPRIAAAVAGDAGALEDLCRVLLPRLRNLARFLLRGDNDVDDAAQDGLIAVLRALPSFRGESQLTTWADRIAVRVILSTARRARVQRARALEMGQTLAPEPLPGRDQERYHARRELAVLMDGLPEEQRQAVVLHHAMGMSVPEVAQLLEIPFETARSRLRLGMAKLRQGGNDG